MSYRLEQLALGLLILGSIAGCRQRQEPESVVRPVRAMKVGDPAAFGGGSLPGRAKATQEVNLSFRVSGPLVELPVDECPGD